MISWLWSKILEFLSGLIAWIFDPVKWLEVAAEVLGKVLDLVSRLLPPSLATKAQEAGDFITGVKIEETMKAVLFFASPAVHAEVLMAVLGISLTVWVVSLLLKIIFNIKGHVWSASS